MENRKVSRGLIVVLVIGVAIAAAWWYEAPSNIDVTRAGSSVAPTRQFVPSERILAASTAGPAERDLDLAALHKSMAGRPDADAEVRRVVAFARFQDQVDNYGENRANMPDADKRILAQQILGELPEHVAREEVLPMQAEELSAALLIDIEPNLVTRDAAIQTMKRQWDDYSAKRVGPSPEEDPRFKRYSQQETQIVDQVLATVRDPNEQQIIIRQRLDALRTQIYDGAKN